jgi:hypothetical protein
MPTKRTISDNPLLPGMLGAPDVSVLPSRAVGVFLKGKERLHAPSVPKQHRALSTVALNKAILSFMAVWLCGWE